MHTLNLGLFFASNGASLTPWLQFEVAFICFLYPLQWPSFVQLRCI